MPVRQATLNAVDEMRWIPVSAAASMLRVTRQRVYQLIESGLLNARMIDRTWFVNRNSVEVRIRELQLEEEHGR